MIYSKLLGAGAILAVAALPNVAHAADPVVPVSDVWTGPYIGAFAGYAWLEAEGEFSSDEITDGGPIEGFLLGGQIGVNKQIESAVVGLEADIAYSDVDGTIDAEGESASVDLNYLATLRARAGLVFGEADSTILFATAGLAVGDFDVDTEGDSVSNTHLGLVVGGGLEHKVTDSISIKAEYNYLAFEKKGLDFDDDGSAEGENISFDGHVVKLGVNFHF